MYAVMRPMHANLFYAVRLTLWRGPPLQEIIGPAAGPAKPAQLRNYFILRTLDLARGTADKLRRAHKRLRNGS